MVSYTHDPKTGKVTKVDKPKLVPILMESFVLSRFDKAKQSFQLVYDGGAHPTKTAEIGTVADMQRELSVFAKEIAVLRKPYLISVTFNPKCLRGMRKPPGWDLAEKEGRLRRFVNGGLCQPDGVFAAVS
jgi:tellurite resistance protein